MESDFVRYNKSGRWSVAAISVAEERYFWGTETNVEEMCMRVAKAVAKTSHEVEDFYELMINQYFFPNSPTIMNAGTGNGLNLSACFVLKVPDDTLGIMKSLTDQVMIHRSGGGTGMSFTHLRPEGSFVNGTQGVASGPVSFMGLYDKATDVIKQGGRRRGANMATIRVDHPDILKFIECKLKGGIENFNISVGITKEFMNNLLSRTPNDPMFFPILDPKDGTMWKEDPNSFKERFSGIETFCDDNGCWVSSIDLFNRICEAAWKTGDPGLLFIDRANESLANPCPDTMQLYSTNPCISGDTKLWTIYGPQKIKDLAEIGEDVPVLTRLDDGTITFRMMSNIGKTRSNVPTINIELESKIDNKISYADVQVTPDHGIYVKTDNGVKKVKAKDLNIGDPIASVYHTELPFLPRESNNDTTYKVISIEQSIDQDVYNGVVDETHKYYICTEDTEGVLISNCGEQWLEDNGACNLGSIVLSKYVKRNGTWPWDKFDIELLIKHTKLAVRFLNNVIDVNCYPTEDIAKQVPLLRRIGLGVMGMADMLFLMGIPYDSNKAIDLCKYIIHIMYKSAVEETVKMGKEDGSFPLFNESRYAQGFSRRNSNLMTIAPTGTISFFGNCSSGCEPVFALEMKHVDGKGTERYIKNQTFIDIMDSLGIDTSKRAKDILADFSENNKDRLNVFVTAHEIIPEWHVLMQAACQDGIDNSVSKTINMPSTATVDDVKKAYMLAYDRGCLGVTVFRDGCKDKQVLYNAEVTTSASNVNVPIVYFNSASAIVTRPNEANGVTYSIDTPSGKIYVAINDFGEIEGEKVPREVFVITGKAGSDVHAGAEAIGRLMSLFLRAENLTPIEKMDAMAQELEGIGGYSSLGFGKDKVRSMPDGVAIALNRYLRYNGNSTPSATSEETASGNLCNVCKNYSLVYEEGCAKCYVCGNSEC